MLFVHMYAVLFCTFAFLTLGHLCYQLWYTLPVWN